MQLYGSKRNLFDTNSRERATTRIEAKVRRARKHNAHRSERRAAKHLTKQLIKKHGDE